MHGHWSDPACTITLSLAKPFTGLGSRVSLVSGLGSSCEPPSIDVAVGGEWSRWSFDLGDLVFARLVALFSSLLFFAPISLVFYNALYSLVLIV